MDGARTHDALIRQLQGAYASMGSALPVGTIIAYTVATAPMGWLVCDGSAVSRTTYSDLYAIIGTTFGVGDGSTTFNVPDLRGRAPYGKGTNTDNDSIGENDGVSEASRTPKHTLTSAEIPAHTHPASSKSFALTDNIAQLGGGLVSAAVNAVSANTGSNTGGGGSHNHGFFVVQWLIKAQVSGDSGVSGTPTGSAGGVLAGTYPNPSFSVDMATQAELDAVSASLSGYQPLDSDLTAIAALTPSNDDVLQRKAGAWTNRTMAQLATDLDAAGLATDSALSTHEADTSSVHGITDTTKQVPVKIFQPGARLAVQAASTGNLVLSGTQTVDGVALGVGDKCLAKNQTNATENGVYVVAAGAWTRDTAADASDEIFTVLVLDFNQTTVYANSNLTLPTVGVDNITYVEVSDNFGIDRSPANIFALDALAFLYDAQTIEGTWTMGTVSIDQLTAATAYITSIADGTVTTVFSGSTDGDGVAGIAVQDDASGDIVYISGTGKIATTADVDLELKSGLGSSTNQGTVYINGGLRQKAVYKTANYSADHGDFFIGYSTLAAARTLTLPLKSSVANGQKIVVADLTTGTGAGTNPITIVEHATDGGSTVATINVDRARVEIELQNSSWWAGPLSTAWTRTA